MDGTNFEGDNSYDNDPVSFLYNEADWYERRAERMREAAKLIENDDFDGGNNSGNNGNDNFRGDREVSRNRNGNYSGRNNSGNNRGYHADEVITGRGGRGNQSFSDSNNQNDARTIAGRQSHDDDDFSQDELFQFMQERDQRYMHKDGETFDRRTAEGRALYAANMIDDDGYPMENFNRGRGGNRGRNYNGNSGSGRGSNSNRGRSRSTSNR